MTLHQFNSLNTLRNKNNLNLPILNINISSKAAFGIGQKLNYESISEMQK
jgi:hypothetical protein